jgi:hypothetical protein
MTDSLYECEMMQLKRQLIKTCGAKITPNLTICDVDLGNITSARCFCEMVTTKRLPIRLLILCGGYNHYPPSAMTEDEIEYSFGTSYAAQFFITLSLVPGMKLLGPGLVLFLLPSSPYTQPPQLSSAVDMQMVREQKETFASCRALLKISILEAMGLSHGFDTCNLKGTCNCLGLTLFCRCVDAHEPEA